MVLMVVVAGALSEARDEGAFSGTQQGPAGATAAASAAGRVPVKFTVPALDNFVQLVPQSGINGILRVGPCGRLPQRTLVGRVGARTGAGGEPAGLLTPRGWHTTGLMPAQAQFNASFLWMELLNRRRQTGLGRPLVHLRAR